MISKSVSPRQITMSFKPRAERSMTGYVASCTRIGTAPKTPTILLSLNWRQMLIVSRFDWKRLPLPHPELSSLWSVLAIQIPKKQLTKSVIPSWRLPWTTLTRRDALTGWSRAISSQTCFVPLTKGRTVAPVTQVDRLFWKGTKLRTIP